MSALKFYTKGYWILNSHTYLKWKTTCPNTMYIRAALNVIWLPYTFPLRSINKFFFFFGVVVVWFITFGIHKYRMGNIAKYNKKIVSKICFSNFFFFLFRFFSLLEKGTTDYHLPCFTSSSSSNFHSNDSVRGAANVVHVYDTILYV